MFSLRSHFALICGLKCLYIGTTNQFAVVRINVKKKKYNDVHAVSLITILFGWWVDVLLTKRITPLCNGMVNSCYLLRYRTLTARRESASLDINIDSLSVVVKKLL